MTDGTGWWSPPVPVKGERIGITQNVSNVVEALRVLDRWGGRENTKLRSAIKTCSEAMEGLATVEEARKAFERAAKATDNLMPML